MIFSKKVFILIISLAIIVRLFLMSFTYHPDLSGQVLSSYFFASKNVFNIYDYLLNLTSDHPLVKNFGVGDIFIYPPLTYFTLGIFQKILSIFNIYPFIESVMNGISIYSIPNLSLNLLILKLPYLFLDILVAYFLTKLFDKLEQKRLIFILWIFNPVTLYATFCMGVFDIIPVFFTVLSLFFIKNKKFLLSALMLGFGVAYKMYPIYLLPILSLGTSKNFKEFIKTNLAGILPLIVTNIPFISSSAYRYMVFSPKSQKMLFMEWMLSGSEGIYPFIFLFTILLIFTSQNKSKFIHISNQLYLSFFLILLSVTHFHPQWFLWITPFILIDLVMNKFKNGWSYLILFIIYIFIIFTFENSLSIGLFAVINNNLNNFVGISSIISKFTDIYLLKSLARSVFAGISLYLSYDLLVKNSKQ